jgi:DNA-directed RNA polymerase subunit beta
LAARVLNTWHEDFVDEDTGEVVSIERNEIILIEIPLSIKIMLKKSLILTLNLFCYIKKMLIKLIMPFIIRYKKIQQIEKEAVEHIYRQLRNAEPPDETARGIIDKLFF